MVNLLLGSIFDSKCDLLIIPCNDHGAVTASVSKEISLNDLPWPYLEMRPGEVHFEEINRKFSNASVLGYAASVSERRSRVEYLQNISKSIKQYCINNSLHIVNVPLLGTGAGRMQPQDSFEALKAQFVDTSSICLNVFAYSADVYNKINYQKKNNKYIKNPRVFISYAGNDQSNSIWVKKLASKLRENGVDARLDIFHLKPGQDLPQWMTNELVMADKVLLICDKFYAEKADSRRGGVGWETMIIQGDMLSHADTGKYICIVRDKEIDKGLPIYVRSKYSLHWPNESFTEEDFKILLYDIFDCDIEPELGEIPVYIIEKKLANKA
ncbi:MAG: TIR domain-containing protein [Lachnospiraceae bacterium]|jgi:hypothetical protein|nr:TIR domain-containing protein [Lachnospiraceae bacterium]